MENTKELTYKIFADNLEVVNKTDEGLGDVTIEINFDLGVRSNREPIEDIKWSKETIFKTVEVEEARRF